MRALGIFAILAGLTAPAAAAWEVCIERASVLPVKTDGRPWDGMGRRVPKGEIGKAMTQVMAGNPQGAAVTALAGLVTRKSAPEPRGMIVVNGKTVLTTHHHKSELEPVWVSGNCVMLSNRDATSGRINIVFQDMDALDNDMIGSVLFNRGFPADALAAGKWVGRDKTHKDALLATTLTFRSVKSKKKNPLRFKVKRRGR